MPRGIRVGNHHGWISEPILIFGINQPTTVNLATYVYNPKNKTLVYAVASGSLPSGATLSGSVVTWSGVGSSGATPVRFSITYNGVTQTSPQASVAILLADTTPPSIPTGLSATAVSQSQVNLSWSASTDPQVSGATTSGLSGYKVYRNGVLIAPSVTLTSYQDTGLTASTQYTYAVSSIDLVLNESSQSATAQATTQAAASGNNLYVRPGATGANNGTDWTNAFTALPTTLVRGATYYLADGTYAGRTFNTANSGTSVITLKKATIADHGTDTGWSTAFGDGQAVFGECTFTTDFYVVDGQRRNAAWQQGAVSEYGIRFQGTGGKTVRLDFGGAGQGGDNLTFRYCDLVGAGRDTGFGDDVVYSLANNSNVIFQYCSLRDSDRTIFITAGGMTGWLVDHCYIARNTSTPAVHAEMMSSWGSATNITFSHNIIEDIEGTAIWAFINDGNATNWKIYGNVIFHTAAFHAAGGREGITGSIFCANDASNNNFLSSLLYYNNTHWNIKGLWSGVIIQGTTSGNEVRNNIWHSCVRTANSFTGTTSHNLYYNTVQDGDSTPTKVVLTAGQSDIFQSTTGNDFRLKVATAAGQTLAPPYDVDQNGNTRGADGTWDRGAFEFT